MVVNFFVVDLAGFFDLERLAGLGFFGWLGLGFFLN